MMTDGVIGILLAHLRAFGCIMFFFNFSERTSESLNEGLLIKIIGYIFSM